MTPLIAWFMAYLYDIKPSWYPVAVMVWFFNFMVLTEIVLK